MVPKSISTRKGYIARSLSRRELFIFLFSYGMVYTYMDSFIRMKSSRHGYFLTMKDAWLYCAVALSIEQTLGCLGNSSSTINDVFQYAFTAIYRGTRKNAADFKYHIFALNFKFSNKYVFYETVHEHSKHRVSPTKWIYGKNTVDRYCMTRNQEKVDQNLQVHRN